MNTINAFFGFFQLRRVSCDVDNLHSSRARQKGVIELKERQVAEANERERQAVVALQEEQCSARDSREQLRKLQALLTEKDSRFGHEVKRKDQEILKLKDRVLKLLADKSQIHSNISSLEVSHLMAKPEGGSRGKWKSSEKREEDLVQRVIDDYKEKQQVLAGENAELRECFYNLQYELSRLLLPDNDTMALGRFQTKSPFFTSIHVV